MSDLNVQDLERYDRQISIENFGKKGQQRLKKAHVVIAGVGGLGAVVSIYLAAAGIGHLTIIDPEAVELSNLNRQILHWEKDIGRKKISSAIEKLRHFNSDIEVTGVEARINEDNVLDLLQVEHAASLLGADAIVDCLDNLHTRYLLNDTALKLGIPFFHGACYGFEGRVTTIIPGMTPCLRCIYPQSPPKGKIPVIGTTPGTIGTIQATEVIKFFIGMQSLLTGRLLVYDAEFMAFDLIEVERNPKCPSCENC